MDVVSVVGSADKGGGDGRRTGADLRINKNIINAVKMRGRES